MTPKEKAEKLCYDIALELPPRNGYIYAKQCALIAVDEVLDSFKLNSGIDIVGNAVLNFAIRKRKYWQEVKQEIEKL